jgi:hypothetical protein
MPLAQILDFRRLGPDLSQSVELPVTAKSYLFRNLHAAALTASGS